MVRKNALLNQSQFFFNSISELFDLQKYFGWVLMQTIANQLITPLLVQMKCFILVCQYSCPAQKKN